MPQNCLKLSFQYHIDNMSENRLDFILAYHRKHPWRYEMSKKSKWKTGKEIIDEEGIKEIEFFDDYVRKGLQPHNKLGRPISPSNILKPDLKGKMSAEKRHRSASIEDPIRDTMENIRRTFDPILRKKELEDSWNVFELPKDDSKAVSVLRKLRDSLYNKDDIKNFRAPLDSEKEKKKPAKKGMRESTKTKLEVQRVAKEIYDKHSEFYPEIDSYKKMAKRKDIKDAGGKHYQSSLQKWISEVAPDWAKKPGIRPKKK